MIAGRRLCEAESSILLLVRVCDRIKRFLLTNQTPQKIFAPITRAFFVDKLSKIALIAFCLSASIPLFGASAVEEAFSQGLSAYARGDFQEAIKHFTQAIKIDPNDAVAYYNRGNTYGKLGDLKSATKDARKACELSSCLLLQIMGQYNKIRD